MLEQPGMQRYSPKGSENPTDAANQQGRLGNQNPQRLHATPCDVQVKI